jgi:hypothetical protein
MVAVLAGLTPARLQDTIPASLFLSFRLSRFTFRDHSAKGWAELYAQAWARASPVRQSLGIIIHLQVEVRVYS